ncbi:MAG: PilT/PilU family type 4a pilus ATPase [Bacteroidetes bacterium]|nr:PilT/PilU family type 4a pilus ATPase [Bacteroidota bacterium]
MDIKDLLKVMVERDASDIYVTTEVPPMYRIDGETQPIGGENLTPEQTSALANSMMNEKQRVEFENTFEMNLALYYPEMGRFRVNIFYQRKCVGFVIRQIKTEIMTCDQLGLPATLKDIVMTKRGLVLVVGGTGSGKSTSLAAMIDHRNSTSTGHIITVEDPVEYVHPHKKCVITQREVGTDTITFGAALKNTLRQAPDVKLVGEIRDTETMEAAITFAETGHLCMGTLHSNNANQTLERIINFFPAERHPQIYQLLSLNLKAIISQRLIPSIDGKRVAAIEILLGTPRVQDLILKGDVDTLKETMAAGAQEGMQTFDQALYKHYKDGKINFDTAVAYADSANDLRLRVKLESGGEVSEGASSEEQGSSPFSLRQ